MKKLALLISILLTISLLTSPVYADCRGCCSRHGGVDCIDGVTKCRDGTPLSQKCIAKDCNKCGTVSSTPTPAPVTTETRKSVTVSPLPVSPGSFQCNGHVAYGIPGPEDQLLCRESYTVGYDYDTKVPTWVAYRLTPDSVNKKFKRSNKFKSGH